MAIRVVRNRPGLFTIAMTPPAKPLPIGCDVEDVAAWRAAEERSAVEWLLNWLCCELLDRERNYWECVIDDDRRPGTPIRWNCTHKHGGFEGSVRCALVAGPLAKVIRMKGPELSEFTDAQVFHRLMRRRKANGEDLDGDQLSERWLQQRVAGFDETELTIEWLDRSTNDAAEGEDCKRGL